MVEFKGSTDSVVYTHFTLSEVGFDSLVTFNAPFRFEKDGKFFLKSLCAVRLCEAVEIVLKKTSNYGGHGASISEKLNLAFRDTPEVGDEWFKVILSLSKSYDYNCVGKLWIRTLSNPDPKFSGGLVDGKENPDGSFYITDGNRRALIHALKLKTGEFAYRNFPIKAIHATTWSNISGVLEWQAAKSCQLKNNGVFDKNQQRKFYLKGHEEHKSIRVLQ